jgi:hypothetical protein
VALGRLSWEAGRVPCITALRFWSQNNEIRYKVRALEDDLPVEQSRSVEASRSDALIG